MANKVAERAVLEVLIFRRDNGRGRAECRADFSEIVDDVQEKYDLPALDIEIAVDALAESGDIHAEALTKGSPVLTYWVG